MQMQYDVTYTNNNVLVPVKQRGISCLQYSICGGGGSNAFLTYFHYFFRGSIQTGGEGGQEAPEEG